MDSYKKPFKPPLPEYGDLFTTAEGERTLPELALFEALEAAGVVFPPDLEAVINILEDYLRRYGRQETKDMVYALTENLAAQGKKGIEIRAALLKGFADVNMSEEARRAGVTHQTFTESVQRIEKKLFPPNPKEADEKTPAALD